MKNLKVALMAGLLMVGQGLMAEDNSWSDTVTKTSKKILAAQANFVGPIIAVPTGLGVGLFGGACAGFYFGAEKGCDLERIPADRKTRIKYLENPSPLVYGCAGLGAVGAGVYGAVAGAVNYPVYVYHELSQYSYSEKLKYLNNIGLRDETDSEKLEYLKNIGLRDEIYEIQKAVLWSAIAASATAVTVGTVGTVAWLLKQAIQK